MAAPPSPHVLALVATLVEQRAGLHYRLAEHELLEDKVVSYALDRGYQSLLDFYYHLRYDDADDRELDALIEALLVHETYFFRELSALEVAVDSFVAPVVAAGRRARIWSAACSTGEEPLSLAILLAERGLLERCDLVASDISEPALARARRARYRGRSLRNDGIELAARWLERADQELVVPRRIVDSITWLRLNLCDADAVAELGRFDLVLCRHVLIYFADDTIAGVVKTLANRLREGGGLLVGISESLLRFSTELQCEEIDRTFVYRRVG